MAEKEQAKAKIEEEQPKAEVSSEKEKEDFSEEKENIVKETENPEEEKEEAPVADEEKKEIPGVKVSENIESWTPKTSLGRKVKNRKILSLSEILDNGLAVLEPKIVDALVPDIESDLLLVGQSKGKFGGGQRRIFKQTQKKSMEGNKPSFSAVAVVGNKNGFVGIGNGKSRETVPAREKAVRKAKLNIFKIQRGCGSWECSCREPHTIPFTVEGKCGSVRIILKPAPKGKGLIVEPECGKILKLAGIKDVWSKTFGQTKVKTNLINACVKALKKLIETKILSSAMEELGVVEGPVHEKIKSTQ